MPPLFPATIALYGIACVLSFSHLFGPNPGERKDTGAGLSRVARIALILAFASHALDIAWLCTKGMHPLVNAKEALSFAAWMTCGAYLFISARYRSPALGVVIVPITLIFDLAARLGPAVGSPGAGASSWLAIVHIVLASGGTALFAVAAGGAILYLFEERNLKQHRQGRLSGRGPALATLDTLNRRCIAVGFSMFTVALVTGAVWQLQMPGPSGLWSPQYILASLAWLLYAALIAARISVGFRGRRAAVLTVFGAVTAIGVLVIYFVRDVRGA